MNTIRFEQLDTDQWYGKGVSIYIDDQDLIDLARDIESPFACEEGHPEIAGSYSPIPAKDLLDNLRAGMQENDRVELFACGDCGEIGCWPLAVRIKVQKDTIIWHDFEQPHRRGTWQYDKLGPFLFYKQEYEEALTLLQAWAYSQPDK